MRHGTTTSIRLPTYLREELDKAAQSLHRGKSWIIVHALEAYLAKLSKSNLANMARQQSILASKLDKQDDNDWAGNSDESGWN